MPRLKIRPETAQTELETRAVTPDLPHLVAAYSDVPSHQSPALALQAGLKQSWEARNGRDAVQIARIPLGWTLIGTSVVCAAFWYALLKLVF